MTANTAPALKGGRRRYRRTAGEWAFDVINYTVFAILMLACIFPFYFLFINTISSNDPVNRGLILFYPVGVHLDNYVQVLSQDNFLHSAFISLARTVLGTALTIFFSAYAGYLTSKKRMWHRKLWYRAVVVCMYFNAGIIAWYINMMNLGLLNNFLAYILPTIIQPFNIIMVKTYVEQNVPEALEEAAQMDGATILQRFFLVVLPLCGPILATLTVFTAIGQWNSFQDTLFLITDKNLYTLQFILYRYMNESSALANMIKSLGNAADVADNIRNMQSATTIRMTVAMVVVAPVLVVYPFFQRYFVKGIMIGAVKG